jgi:Co/Zn/Cd efflux system component
MHKKEEEIMNMKKIDISVMVLYIAALIVLSFFWGCGYDPIVTAFGGIIVAVSALATFVQYKKMKELMETQQ